MLMTQYLIILANNQNTRKAETGADPGFSNGAQKLSYMITKVVPLPFSD